MTNTPQQHGPGSLEAEVRCVAEAIGATASRKTLDEHRDYLATLQDQEDGCAGIRRAQTALVEAWEAAVATLETEQA